MCPPPPPLGFERHGLDPFGILVPAQTAALGGGGSGPLVASAIASAINSPTTGAIDTTGADLIVVVITGYNVPGAGAITDSEGNTWIAGPFNIGASRSYQRTYYCLNPTTSATHTFGSTTSPLYGSTMVAAFTGFGASAIDFNSVAGLVSAGTSIACGSVTPSASGAVAVSGFSSNNNTASAAVNNGFSILHQVPHTSGQYIKAGLAYKIIPDTTAFDLAWSWSGSYIASSTILGFV